MDTTVDTTIPSVDMADTFLANERQRHIPIPRLRLLQKQRPIRTQSLLPGVSMEGTAAMEDMEASGVMVDTG